MDQLLALSQWNISASRTVGRLHHRQIPKATARRAPEHRPVPPHAAQGMMFRVRNLGRPRGCRIVRTDDFPTLLFDTSSIGSPIGAAEIMLHGVTVR